jgi:hypothetical protein
MRPLIIVGALVLLAAAVIAGVLVLGSDEPGGQTRTETTPAPIEYERFAVVADAYVNADRPTVNYGTADVLRVDGSPTARAYLRFDLRGIAAKPETARLEVLATSDSRQGVAVSRAGNGWSERGITFENAPTPIEGPLIESGAVVSGERTSVDVSALVREEGVVTLVLTAPGPTNVALGSREGMAAAELVVGFRSTTAPIGTEEAAMVAVGDIADCDSTADEAVAQLVARVPGTLATLGDTVYETGSVVEFADCYAPSWERFHDRTRPAVGNHEYLTPDAKGYFDYFGDRAGTAGQGYYSYDLGAWHVVVLNSNCARVGGCQTGSPQERWLAADLAAHPARCTLAYWHHPRFSSGRHGNFEQMKDVWQTLHTAGADLVLAGHDHDYERFAPQSATGEADTERGIVEFVVGTGGKNHRPIGDPEPNSLVRSDDTYGVLALRLRPTGYDWRFVPVPGGSFRDSGSAECH